MKKGLPFRNIIIICCSLTLIFCVAARADEKNKIPTENDLKGVKRIAVTVEQKRDFELYHWRAKTAYGTSSLLGGFKGDAIAHGIDKGKDRKEMEPMMPAVQDLRCSAIFTESLSPLSASRRFEKIYISDANQKLKSSDYDAAVTFTINRWGLRLVEREPDKVAAFVELEARMIKAGEKKPIWNTREVIVGGRKETVDVFAGDGKMLREELQETIKKAGLQISMTLAAPPAEPPVQSKKTKINTGPVTALEINNNINFKSGPLAAVNPLKITVENFTDNRQITDRIGDLRNGFGGKAGKINTARPATEFVREAVVSVFNKNGHITDSNEKNIVISGSVETYWFEPQLRMSSWELMGSVDVNMVVRDGRSGNILLSKRYSGHNNVVKGIFGPRDIINIMDSAMGNMTDQISSDPRLVEAIKNYGK